MPIDHQNQHPTIQISQRGRCKINKEKMKYVDKKHLPVLRRGSGLYGMLSPAEYVTSFVFHFMYLYFEHVTLFAFLSMYLYFEHITLFVFHFMNLYFILCIGIFIFLMSTLWVMLFWADDMRQFEIFFFCGWQFRS